jgi:predicted 2-oxoglutarate/Fe(II)-dependent dioxygenase YbiX
MEDTYNEDGTCTYSSWYWKDRQCSSEILQRLSPEIHALIDSYIDKMAIVAGELFNCELEKRPPCIIRWFPGIEQQPHADKQLLDGSPNPFQAYDINSLFYYNDDFEGGELYYPELDIVVKPEPGLAVIHPGDIHYLHGVKTITQGERFTSPVFYTVK